MCVSSTFRGVISNQIDVWLESIGSLFISFNFNTGRFLVTIWLGQRFTG